MIWTVKYAPLQCQDTNTANQQQPLNFHFQSLSYRPTEASSVCARAYDRAPYPIDSTLLVTRSVPAEAVALC